MPVSCIHRWWNDANLSLKINSNLLNSMMIQVIYGSNCIFNKYYDEIIYVLTDFYLLLLTQFVFKYQYFVCWLKRQVSKLYNRLWMYLVCKIFYEKPPEKSKNLYGFFVCDFVCKHFGISNRREKLKIMYENKIKREIIIFVI